jgi:hypothetical protein
MEAPMLSTVIRHSAALPVSWRSIVVMDDFLN